MTATRAQLVAAAQTLYPGALAALRFPDNATARSALQTRLAVEMAAEGADRKRWANHLVDGLTAAKV